MLIAWYYCLGKKIRITKINEKDFQFIELFIIIYSVKGYLDIYERTLDPIDVINTIALSLKFGNKHYVKLEMLRK